MSVSQMHSNDMVLVPKSQFSAAPLPPFNVPEQTHEGNIPSGNLGSVATARKYLELTRGRDFNRLAEMRAKPDPRVPMAAHLDELAKEGAKLKAESQKAYDAALKAVDADIASNEGFLEAMGGFKAGSQAAEIRGVLRGMAEQERQAAIGDAVESLDEELLACILSSHPLALGVSADFKAAMRNRYIAKVAPDALAERELLAKTRAVLQAAHPHVMRTIEAASSGIQQSQPQIADAEAVRKGHAS